METACAVILVFVLDSECLYGIECHHLAFLVSVMSLRFNPSVAARNSRITPSVKVRPGEATRCINDFRLGKINLIVATSVIEEGFDVVISYDYLKDTVELSQRFGRARRKESSLTLMSERKDRPLYALKDVKVRQESIIKEYNPSMNKQVSNARRQSQKDRERAAFSVLMDEAKCKRCPLEVLKVYAAKTKAMAKEVSMDLGPDKMFTCKYVYESLTRTVEGIGENSTKQQARNKSALTILMKLQKMDISKGYILKHQKKETISISDHSS